MLNPETNPVIIMGPPSSGTTLLIKYQVFNGMFPGFKLNPSWEDWHWVRANEFLFTNTDRTWDRPLEGKCQFPIGRIEQYIQQKYLDLEIPWGWKDPVRNDVLAVVWEEIFPDANFIRIIRHPMDIALSLKKREAEKPDRLLHSTRLEEDEIFEGDFYAYPPKSSRLLDINEALSYAEDMVFFTPDVDYVKYKFEEFVTGDAQEMGDFVDPSKAYAYREEDHLVDYYEEHKTFDYQSI